VDWKQDLLIALDEAVKLPGGGDATEWKCLGKVSPSGEAGWYSLDLREGQHSRAFGNADSFDQLCLADKEGPDRGTHIPIERNLYADGILKIKIAGLLPKGADFAWTIRLTPRHLLKRLRDGIAATSQAPLADRLAAGTLDPVPSSSSDHPPGFLPGQIAAYQACLTPGLHAVWGPPGTGKTTVLSRAIETLIANRKRVLLVSTANIAVDNALSQVVHMLEPNPGEVIRVGPPQLPELAADDNVQLHRLAARTTAETDAELADVQAELAHLDTVDEQTTELDNLLEGYDHNAYLGAKQRLANTSRWTTVRQDLTNAYEQQTQAVNSLSSTRAAFEFASAEVSRVASQRQALADIERYLPELARLELELGIRRAEVNRLKSTPPPRGLLKRWQATRHRNEVVAEHATYESATLDHIGRLRSLIELRRRDAGPITTEVLHQLDANLVTARERLAAAESTATQARRNAHGLEDEEKTLRASGLATDDDQLFVDRIERQGLAAAHERRRKLRALQQDGAVKRGELEDRLRKLNAKISKLRRDAEGEIVAGAKVIATTLARSRAHRAVSQQEFDVVIVDEAGAAVLAEVMLAVAHARATAVLLGDFLQLTPVVPNPVQEHPKQPVRRWMVPDSFTHCHIRTPEDARRNTGCAVLTAQFRFGPNLQKLANDLLYKVMEDGRERVSGRTTPDTTLVLVDVSELGDLNMVHRSGAVAGWWPVGALLSRALAQHHAHDPGGVGVVTPFREQVDATLSALHDVKVDQSVPVGTAHAFQGREFDTVIFDLVEDGKGWISKARTDRNPFAYGGVRLFGVGITRTRHRLYLITDLQKAVRPATGATPLGYINRLGPANVELCRAGTLLGLGTQPRHQPASTVEAELAEVLREYIQVSEINDDLEFDEALEQHLKAVRHSLWMWSPWVGRKSERFLPLIAAAVSRGVDTRVYIRTERDKILQRQSNERWVEELKATGARIIRAQMEHKKIVVFDDRTVLLGSHNPLSQHGTRDVMITSQGTAFADRLLTELGARKFNQPPNCSKCGRECELWRSTNKKKGQPYLWRCYPCDVKRSR
jgi:superfamily I DNA/RNA helicase